MKGRLRIILIEEESGFAIPIVLGVGLIMMLIATIMIFRSQSDTNLATAQKSTNQALTTAEAGVARVQAFLNNNRYFATGVAGNNPTDWKNSVTSQLGCAVTHNLYTQAQNLENEPSITDDNLNKFRIISYQQVNNPPTDGTLVVEGKTFLSPNEVKSVSRLQVNIPLQREPQISFSAKPPGIWANNYDAGTNKFVVTTVVDSGCTSSMVDSNFSVLPTTPAVPLKIVKNNPSIALPKPLAKPPVCPSSLPTAPPTPCAIKLSEPITDAAVFPKDTDITNYPNGTAPSGEYIYIIPKGTSGGDKGKSINLVEATDRVIIRPDKKVTFYLDGDLRMAQASFLGHDCYDDKPAPPPPTPPTPAPSPAPSPPNGLYDNDNDGDGTFGYQIDRYTPKDTGDLVPECKSTSFQIYGGVSTKKIEIAGLNNVLYAFIFAPNAIGSGLQKDSTTIIKGSVWVKQWKPATPTRGEVILVESNDAEWEDLPDEVKPYNIAPYTAWQRQEIP
jgi:hypothetical protein